MVYVANARYEFAYKRIVEGAGSSQGTSVVIFVSTDADALCGLRILTTLLKRDAIGHKIVPVTNYADISAMNQTLIAGNLQIRTVVLLNCGAQVDIQDIVTLRNNLSVIVVDSHRPFNLYNVFWHEQVQCFDDGDVEQNMVPLKEAFESVEFGGNSDEGEQSSDGEDGDDDDDDDEDGEAVEVGRKRGPPTDGEQQQRRKRRQRTDMDPEEFVRAQERRAQLRDTRAQHQRMIQAYYAQGSYHGQSCAVSMLALAEQLGLPPTLDTVWWAIVGASSQHVLQHIDADGHAVVVRRMRDLVRRVCPAAGTLGSGVSLDAGGVAVSVDQLRLADPGLHSSSSQAMLDSQLGLPDTAAEEGGQTFNPYLDTIDEENDEGYLRAKAGASTNAEAGLLTSTKTVEQRVAISESAELQFTLLRHWSLDNAMRFSPYVATRLATWSSKGRARLDLLLAKLGLSRAEARAPFLHLAPDLKTKLYRKMAEIGSDYNMPDALYPGFVRDYGWRKSRVSASDMVQAVLALLQRNTWENEGVAQTQQQQQHQHQQQQAGFFAAYDALQQFSVLRQGIVGAQLLQRVVVSQGVSMLERQAVKTLRRLRFAILGEVESASTFGNPFALRQLALFLMQTLREQRSNSKKAVEQAARPFVIAAPIAAAAAQQQSDPSGDRLLVLGITPLDYSLVRPHMPNAAFNQSTFAGESRNHFGLVFEDVATEIGAETKQGFFDSSVMEIRRSDMSTFVDRLRRHL